MAQFGNCALSLGPEEVEINPADAEPRGISDGDLLRVYNERGETRLVARITDAVSLGSTPQVPEPDGLGRSMVRLAYQGRNRGADLDTDRVTLGREDARVGCSVRRHLAGLVVEAEVGMPRALVGQLLNAESILTVEPSFRKWFPA